MKLFRVIGNEKISFPVWRNEESGNAINIHGGDLVFETGPRATKRNHEKWCLTRLGFVLVDDSVFSKYLEEIT